MSRNRYVKPSTVRLDLSDGDWIEIKERLSYGDSMRLAGSGLTAGGSLVGEGRAEDGIDWERYKLRKVETWLVEWSFKDEAQKPVPVSRDAIRALDVDSANEIEKAIDAHVATLEQLKNSMTGGSEKSQT